MKIRFRRSSFCFHFLWRQFGPQEADSPGKKKRGKRGKEKPPVKFALLLLLPQISSHTAKGEGPQIRRRQLTQTVGTYCIYGRACEGLEKAQELQQVMKRPWGDIQQKRNYEKKALEKRFFLRKMMRMVECSSFSNSIFFFF